MKDNAVWEAFFHHVVYQVKLEGFLANETWVADETELKANANKRKPDKRRKEMVVGENLDTFEKTNERIQKHGIKLLKNRLC